ncbi:VWA domain-containing protein [Reinekea marinisedimentorum]|uniref:Putative secreted protein n=1 Tax=Reinekea marinisedimentorum TaxID=230495 RepID=A0A4V2UJZ5_9GAMM|nr:VWA domain-containing protein [Reinekea marinisedimentorum]TCS42029.1 putative secreted protein [Reinekea marinisedimentorum]
MKTTNKLLTAGFAVLAAAFSANVSAETFVSWTSPANGSSYDSGSTVTLTGTANTTGSISDQLDLVIVMDSSGSMGSYRNSTGGYCYDYGSSSCKTVQDWQKEAALTLVNNLPAATTSVSIVEFDSYSSTVQTLVSLSTNLADITNAINSVNASGGTNIGTGIDQATSELTGINATAGASSQMVVFSDGYSSGSPAASASAAIAAGVDAVHSVALPGASITTMESIATAGNGTFINATTDISSLTSIFTSGGTLAGLDYVDITLNDGTLVSDVATDAFGNFSIDVVIAAGTNNFFADAYGTDGTSATAQLTLNGRTSDVPEPATLGLLAAGLFGMGAARRKKSAS